MKIKIHYSLIILFFLALLSGFLYRFSIMMILIIFHEMGHIASAKFFNRSVDKFVLLPFGAILKYEEDKNRHLFQDFVIVSSGVMINFFIYLLSKIIHINATIMDFNNYLLVFNLLPIYPLDGGRMIEVFCSHGIRFKKVLSIIPVMSFFFLAFLFVYNLFFMHSMNLFMMLAYLLFENVLAFKDRKSRFQRFLLNKFLEPNQKLAKKKIKSYKDRIVEKFHKGRYNYIQIDDKSKGEEVILNRYYKK